MGGVESAIKKVFYRFILKEMQSSNFMETNSKSYDFYCDLQ